MRKTEYLGSRCLVFHAWRSRVGWGSLAVVEKGIPFAAGFQLQEHSSEKTADGPPHSVLCFPFLEHFAVRSGSPNSSCVTSASICKDIVDSAAEKMQDVSTNLWRPLNLTSDQDLEVPCRVWTVVD